MLFKGPADIAVEEVHVVLRNIVASTINSEECKNLLQYAALKREIVNTASAALGRALARVQLCWGAVYFKNNSACSLRIPSCSKSAYGEHPNDKSDCAQSYDWCQV